MVGVNIGLVFGRENEMDIGDFCVVGVAERSPFYSSSVGIFFPLVFLWPFVSRGHVIYDTSEWNDYQRSSDVATHCMSGGDH